ncbi:hypothetical protein [Cryobacterium soli]|uniref:hypothetical protein n=1 Tax=Cryobacterium soli TaxID=2220095 RepID=UPI000E762951|nr:hypothetical protein [Cryobacterium soli]
MTVTNLYAKYLQADRMNKIAEAAGVRVDYARLDNGDSINSDVTLQCSILNVGFSAEGEANEEAAERLMLASPSLIMERKNGLIYLTGITSQGITYKFYTGGGVCERVQVGTRILPAEPAKPAREEPIFEVRCIDPLNALVTA